MRQAAINGPFTLDLGQSEIQHLDHASAALLREHEVARLDIAVDHALLMCVLETQRGLMDVIACVCDRQRSLGPDQLGKVQAVHEFHRKDNTLAQMAGRVRRDDIGVLQAGRIADFDQEAIPTPGRFMRWLLTTFNTSSRPNILFRAR